jgi:3-oxoacyl-(acyl-carrier-protein) synthase
VRIVVSGIGVASSIGLNARSFARAMFAGRDGVGDVARVETGKLKNHRAYEVLESVPTRRPGESRLLQLGRLAAGEALEDAGVELRDDAYLLVGSGLGDEEVVARMARGEADPEEPSLRHRLGPMICADLGLGGGTLGNGTACSAGLTSIAVGSELVRSGECRAVIAGGADTFSLGSMAYFDRVSVQRAARVTPFDVDRKGLLLGEGAGFVMIEPRDAVLERKGSYRCEILGYGLSSDAFHLSNMKLEGVAAAMSAALADAGLGTGDIDYIAAHGTGTALNDPIESQAIHRVFGADAARIAVSSVKSMIGHTAGASGVIGLVSGILALEAQTCPPTLHLENPDPACALDLVRGRPRRQPIARVMVNAFGFGGGNCSVVVGAERRSSRPLVS